MAKNNNQPLLKSGSTGSDVKKMQQSLIKAGYDVGKTGADGIVGPNTVNAIKQYQKDNGLAVDGIAGPKTLGNLYGPTAGAYAVDADGNYALPSRPSNTAGTGGGTADEQTPAETAAPPPTFSHVPSATVQAANQLLQQHMNGRPGAYQSQWQDEINKYMDQYINRDPFSYDFNSDALYQMYKDQYIQQGQMAMMDTMGQAAAMTGGYGNSYAQTVGQQVYNQQLAQLNNIIPELYQMAYGKYRDEGQDLLNAFNMYMDRDNQDYGRHQDNLNNWWRETEYLTDRADTEYERDYNSQWDSYTSEYNSYWDNYEKEYQEGRDTIDDQRYDYEKLYGLIGSTGYEPTADELKAAGMTRAEANALKNEYTNSKSGSKGNGNGNDPSGYDNGNLADYQVEILQEELGITVDGKWGKDSFKAAGNMTADEAWKAYKRGELGAKDPDPVFSDAAKAFMSNLPYAHAGSSAEAWKQVVDKKLRAQYENGTLTEEDVKAIIIKLGL